MDDNWYELDFDGTIRDFDFTKKALRDMRHIVNSEEFEEMDSEIIFRYLRQGVEAVSFKDYLKRYLYKKAEIREPYSEVEDGVYQDIIRESFVENCAPHSFAPTSKKWSATIKDWLRQDCVKRQTIFLLGFGLRMRAEDVSDFLLKVQREHDFNFYDKYEVLYWFCYKNQYRYPKAKELLERYEELPPAKTPGFPVEEGFRLPGPEIQRHLCGEPELLNYLSWLKTTGIYDQNQTRAYQSFCALFHEAQQQIAEIYQEDEKEKCEGEKPKKQWEPEEITPGDVEKMICSGVPVDARGNLWKMSLSLLKERFQQCRLSRQRIDSLLKQKLQVDRFDLITLGFFVCSQEDIDTDPEERSRKYIKEMNAILEGCGMSGLYPVHPYEAFILMCLLSECPLAIYSEVWELSYEAEF